MPPSEDAIRLIAATHGIPESADLPRRLEEEWYWWRQSKQLGSPTPGAVRRQFLREVARRALALEESINKAGADERRALLDTFPPTRFNLDALATGAHDLWLAASIASRHVPKTKAGHPGDPATHSLLCKIWLIYREAHGAGAPKISRSDEYGGAFFRFAEDVLRVFGERKSNNALGKAIEKALAAVKRREGRVLSPK